MPPLPAWFSGRADIGRFLAGRMFATPWRLVPISANGQLAFACYQGRPRAPAGSGSARSTWSACAAGGSRSWPGSSTRPCTATSASPRSDEFRTATAALNG